jgi:hypothetical protein
MNEEIGAAFSMKKQPPLFAILALVFCLAPGRATTLIYDQSPPNNNSADIVNFRLADDFTLSGASVVMNIDFWYQAQFQTDLSNVTYAIYANSSNHPGTQLFTGTVAPVTSFDSPNNAFFATFAVPNLSLAAGKYWLELHGGSSLIDSNGGITVFWAATADNATLAALSSSVPSAPSTSINTSGFEQYAFQLNGTGPASGPPGMPEPTSALLVASGLLILKKIGRVI